MFKYKPELEPGSDFFLKYSMYVIIMIILVVFYVWQNVEVLKMKIALSDSIDHQKQIIISNDFLINEIEKLKRIDLIEVIAAENNLKEVQYEDVVVIRKDSVK